MALKLIADESIGFRMPDVLVVGFGIDVQLFSFDEEPDDKTVLEMLLRHRWYDFTYAGPRAPDDEPMLNIHGPYVRSFIGVKHFHAVAPAAARLRIESWAAEWARSNFTREGSTRLHRDLLKVLPDTNNTYELENLRDSAEHEWGSVVGGAGGFHEYVTIDRSRSTVGLVVATDD